MQTAIDDLSIPRRGFFQLLGAASAAVGLGLSKEASAEADHREIWLAATWQSGRHYYAGLVGWDGLSRDSAPRIRSQIQLPSRAHGVHVEPDGSLLVVARRPGDWLLRWHPDRNETPGHWHWIDDDHRFTGHVLGGSAAGIWTTETRLEHARGFVSLRDPSSLERVHTWPTEGFDPHMMWRLADALGALPAGTLLVANGGIPTLPETGRVKHDLHRMDASLVAFAPFTGERLGAWRLSDPRLSIRHLTFDPLSQRVGIALQAQHDSDLDQRRAPVLAVFDGSSLTACTEQPPQDGYGGDLCARPGGGFLVGCPKSNRVVAFDGDGHWLAQWHQTSACSLDQRDGHWWSGGENAVLEGSGASPAGVAREVAAFSRGQLRFDNHWRVWTSA